MKVLIVEDEQRLGQFLERGLKEFAYTVTLVGTCKDALDALAETSYDVIVLDLGLPDGDGLDLLQLGKRAMARIRLRNPQRLVQLVIAGPQPFLPGLLGVGKKDLKAVHRWLAILGPQPARTAKGRVPEGWVSASARS